MNYLAHVLLAGEGEEARIGGLLGDFVKGDPAGLYPWAMEREIRVHRRLDAFVDGHPVFRHAKERFLPERRRFAGVVMDVFFDHVLAQTWQRWCTEDLRVFTDTFYKSLSKHHAQLPEQLQRILPALIQHDWLASYVDYANVEIAVQRMAAKRMKRGEGLVACLVDLRQASQHLQEAFFCLFPDVQAYAAETRQRLEQ